MTQPIKVSQCMSKGDWTFVKCFPLWFWCLDDFEAHSTSSGFLVWSRLGTCWSGLKQSRDSRMRLAVLTPDDAAVWLWALGGVAAVGSLVIICAFVVWCRWVRPIGSDNITKQIKMSGTVRSVFSSETELRRRTKFVPIVSVLGLKQTAGRSLSKCPETIIVAEKHM